MPDRFDMFRDAYDKTTGKKLPHKVPESHFEIFPNLRKTPIQRVRDNIKAAQATPKATTADEKEK